MTPAREQLMHPHLKLVAKASLVVGAVAVLVLLVVLEQITGPAGESYGAIIRAHSITRAHLGHALLVAGLLLLALTGVITWIIAYYSSLRVAGPLYRFSQNLKLASNDDQSAPLALRRGDALRRQAAQIEAAVSGVRAHKAALRAAAAAAADALERGDAHAYGAALARLNEIDAQAQL
jgi:hypothetical protein